MLSLGWAACSAQSLVIGLYDYSELSARETASLTEAADQAFGHSGIHVVWRHCRGVLPALGRRAKSDAGTRCPDKA